MHVRTHKQKQTFPSHQVAEVGISPSLGPAWATQLVPSQLSLCSKTLPQDKHIFENSFRLFNISKTKLSMQK